MVKEWQAYVSSALTISDALEGKRIRSLNTGIKQWLHKIKVFAYLPQEYPAPDHNAKMSPEEVYVLDRWRVAESDFVIMNLDHPSFGVGQVAEIAASVGIPIIPFHYYQIQVSRVIKDNPGIFITESEEKPSQAVIAYEDVKDYSDLQEKLMTRVKSLQKTIDKSQTNTEERTQLSFSSVIEKAIRDNKETVQSLAKKLTLSPDFLETLLSDDKDIHKIAELYEIFKIGDLRDIPINKYSNPGIWIFDKLNIINIQHMEGSQVQQGAVSSKQSGTFESVETKSIMAFLELLREKLPDLRLNSSDDSEMRSDINTIENQILSSRPKGAILRECLGSIQRILEGAGGSIISQQLLQYIPSLIGVLGK